MPTITAKAQTAANVPYQPCVGVAFSRSPHPEEEVFRAHPGENEKSPDDGGVKDTYEGPVAHDSILQDDFNEHAP